jgi:hypothetical protein
MRFNDMIRAQKIREEKRGIRERSAVHVSYNGKYGNPKDSIVKTKL